MTIDRRQIFTLAWKRAKAFAAGQSPRRFFADALRAVWGLVKAMVAEEAHHPVAPRMAKPAAWADESPYRARAVAARQRRLGSYSLNCW